MSDLIIINTAPNHVCWSKFFVEELLKLDPEFKKIESLDVSILMIFNQCSSYEDLFIKTKDKEDLKELKRLCSDKIRFDFNPQGGFEIGCLKFGYFNNKNFDKYILLQSTIIITDLMFFEVINSSSPPSFLLTNNQCYLWVLDNKILSNIEEWPTVTSKRDSVFYEAKFLEMLEEKFGKFNRINFSNFYSYEIKFGRKNQIETTYYSSCVTSEKLIPIFQKYRGYWGQEKVGSFVEKNPTYCKIDFEETK